MPIEVKCGGCGRAYNVSDAFANKRARCLVCGAVTVVPDHTAEVSDFDLAAHMSTAAQAAAAAMPAHPGEDVSVGTHLEETDEPRVPMPVPVPVVDTVIDEAEKPPEIARPQPVRRRLLGFRIDLPIAVCLIVGGALGYFGWRDWRVTQTAAETPQTITCLQLEKNGPGANHHLHLTGFTGLAQGYLFAKQNAEAKEWSAVWIPVVSIDGAHMKAAQVAVSLGQNPANIQPPLKINVILKSTEVVDAAQEDRLVRKPAVEGLLVNGVEPLTDTQLDQLKSRFPATDFSGAWIVEIGRRPPSTVRWVGLMGGGGALLLLGCYWMLRPR